MSTSELQRALIDTVAQGIHDADATRYLSGKYLFRELSATTSHMLTGTLNSVRNRPSSLTLRPYPNV